ncbi:MAG: CoA transferase [SAR202 cluster bacterium]|nr:hypothetical protein [Chloroflexota bacterium]MDP6422213.1 CoA transferase [SAR202 cluster bacterium]MDP6663685.1 CoA transferase [SAR202 cluster bacterium]MDP6800825.1 CoA transferase [SAR202 cluster bacterium]MQG57181.1 CoA transferase [SAR202 cluster bacterium]
MSKPEYTGGGSLSDLRVLDLTRVWAGPLATRILGDFGAQIIRIVDPRSLMPRASGYDNKLSRNKLNMAVRLDKDAGRQILLELASISDVVIENFRPRVMRNLRLSYDEIKAVNSEIVMCSMPGFGLEGPYSEYPAYGTTAEAFVAMPWLIGYDQSAPMPTGIAYGDPISGLNTVGALLASLRKRNMTGGGQFIDVALVAGPATTTGEFFVANSADGYEPEVRCNRQPDQAPHSAYKAAGDDNWIAIAVTSDEEWNSLCAIVDDESLCDARFSDLEGRKHHEDAIDNVISEWVKPRDAEELTALLQEAGVPAGRVANSRQLLDDRHLAARDFYVEFDEPEVGPKPYEGQSIPGNHVDKSRWQRAHQMGQDSRHVLVDLLGYSNDDCDALASEETVAFSHDMPNSAAGA